MPLARYFHKIDRQLLILGIAQKDASSLDKYAVGAFAINALMRPTIKYPLRKHRNFIRIITVRVLICISRISARRTNGKSTTASAGDTRRPRFCNIISAHCVDHPQRFGNVDFATEA